MLFIVFGSSGALGSFLIDSLNSNQLNTLGLDLNDSETTDYVIDFRNIENFSNLLEQIIRQTQEPICSIYCAIPSSRIRGECQLKEYIKSENNLIELHINSLLIISDTMEKYCISNFTGKDKDKSNHLINIGSVLSERVSLMESPIYSASKSAAHSLIKYLSVRLLSKKISCNTISPGLMARNVSSERYILEKLSKLNKNIGITPYSDILQTIEYIVNTNLNSFKGQNIILDNSLENLEAFYIIDSIEKSQNTI